MISRIAGSNLAKSNDARLCISLCCVGSGVCDGLITHTEKSYRVCVLETSTMMRTRFH
jgi:hypothetical protein